MGFQTFPSQITHTLSPKITEQSSNEAIEHSNEGNEANEGQLDITTDH